ncbi:MAG: MBL fold metallo-hydrolase [Thermodesulfobacteriota bacterium]
MKRPGPQPPYFPQDPTNDSAISADSSGLCLCMLASGSKGNSIYISSGQTAILFDAGLSGKEIERRMKLRGLLPQQLDAIVVSHEHSDHIQGVGVLARRFGLPVYIAPETHDAAQSHLGTIQALHPFECGTAFAVNDLRIRPFSVSHDAAAPAGFTIENGGGKIGLATDLGIATAMVRHHLRDCDLLVLEANHDPCLLETGPYPWPVKQRVKGRTGHLSNESAKALLMDLLHDRLAHVVLAHISESNNTPEQALQVVTEQVGRHPVQFSIACQDRCGEIISLP